MFDLIRKSSSQQTSAKHEARRRLHDALTQDRVDLGPEAMDALRKELLAVITRYMDVAEGFQEFEIRRVDGWPALVARVRVRELQQELHLASVVSRK